eukprot:TRINITY_DN8139_c0_g1_i1.p1 TRINITY_DN8139_c0_g1~~TRINITY_DN8139_c0_g1_i1.p1  ORF type:complete len:460 (-),score=112.40 TRINITY_DN8139_c0_g1_i1:40-1419(-)
MGELIKQQDAQKSLSFRPNTSQKVLEEDNYVEYMTKIIQRDFFPDLPKLNDNLEWLEAKRKGDFAKLQEIQERYERKKKAKGSLKPFETPNFSATPVLSNSGSTIPQSVENNAGLEKSKSEDGNKTDELPTLDAFHEKFTSEDNASFENIMQKTAEKFKEKYWWLHDPNQKLLMNAPSSLISWKYEAKNQLMYNPDGVGTLRDLDQKGDPKGINHSCTRIHGEIWAKKPPIKKTKEKKEQDLIYTVLKDGHSLRDLLSRHHSTDEKIDLDDLLGSPKRAVPQSPKVNGYGFVLTPSPVPGASDASPFITWGKIESTPMRLDPTDTPLDLSRTESTPQFRVPEPPFREKIGHKLAEKTRKRNIMSSSSRGKNTPLSSAGRDLVEKLAKRSGSIEDRQLRASYGTPVRGNLTPKKTGSSSKAALTPRVVIEGGKRSIEEIGVGGSGKKRKSSSITDNLIDI